MEEEEEETKYTLAFHAEGKNIENLGLYEWGYVRVILSGSKQTTQCEKYLGIWKIAAAFGK